ncbi:hypothetical protein K0U83_22865 [bacterium]|nr:hypothetical protein [bacterium]
MSLPPHNLTAEYSVLGSILFEPAIFWRVEDILTDADFFDPLHGDVFCRLPRSDAGRAGGQPHKPCGSHARQ